MINYLELWKGEYLFPTQTYRNMVKAILRGKCIAYSYDSFVTGRLIINEHSVDTKKFHEEQKDKPK